MAGTTRPTNPRKNMKTIDSGLRYLVGTLERDVKDPLGFVTGAPAAKTLAEELAATAGVLEDLGRLQEFHEQRLAAVDKATLALIVRQELEGELLSGAEGEAVQRVGHVRAQTTMSKAEARRLARSVEERLAELG